MTTRSPAAGGFFLILCILAGFGYGASKGAVVPYTLIGTAIGIGVALLVWLLDRRRA